MIPQQPQIHNEKRVTDEGLEVTCGFLNPQDITVVPAVLEDHTGRKHGFMVKDSCCFVIVPIGELGDVVFDPIGERDSNGRWIFRQRTTMCSVDVLRIIESQKRMIELSSAIPPSQLVRN